MEEAGRSEESSIASTSENESKKQMLVSAFGNQDSMVALGAVIGVNLLIVFLQGLLIILVVFSSIYAEDLLKIWKKNYFVQEVYNIYDFRTSLVEADLLLRSQNVNDPFIE